MILLLLFSAPLCAQESRPVEEISKQFQARIDDLARELGNDPRLKRMTYRQRQALTEFVVGNTLFVLVHEIGHVAIAELGLPVLGREEDAADSFAVVTLLKMGTDLSHRVLVEAAKGWFLSDRRDRDRGEMMEFYDAHGLGKQRAYYIVCLMVGSDPNRFKDLADETKLPEERRESCQADYSNAEWSWQTTLEPHYRKPGQPRTAVEPVYGEGKGDLATYERSFRGIRILEVLADYFTDTLAWPQPFALEMSTCGESDAGWYQTLRKVIVCYEIAQEYAQLYRDYADDWKSVRPRRRR